MDNEQWLFFLEFRNSFKSQCKIWKEKYNEILIPLQMQARDNDKVPEYPIENSIVYNTDLDKISSETEISLIVVGDNPGKNEQLSVNCRYLVGQSGKIAQGFFQKNPELKIDFRKNVLILNKTPVHTAKTKELLYLCSQNEELKNLIKSSQIWMANQTAKLQKKLQIPIWIVGYGEIKEKGIFDSYRQELLKEYNDKNIENIFVFQHFSMNRFLIDLKEWQQLNENSGKKLSENLNSLGTFHRKRIFNI